MEKDYVRGDSSNLPKVDIQMIIDFFTSNPCYNSAEIRGVKLLKSGRESYGDDAIGYVQVKRENDTCIVKARVTPEHKVRSKPYHCTFQCNEKEEIITGVNCEDCAAREGGCKHVVALIMWLHRRSEEPSSTSVKCYWTKAKLSSVGTSLKFIKAKDLVSSKKRFNIIHESSPQDNQSDFFYDVVAKSRELKIDSQLMLYNEVKSDCPKNFSLHYLLCKYKNKDSMKDINADSFIQFCEHEMENNMVLKEIFQATKEQADCPLWHELRYGRITASKIFEIAHCKTENGSLVEHIMGGYSFKETIPIKRGKLLEKQVLGVLEEREKIKIEKSGFIMDNKFPIIGVSPDGLTTDFVIEIKCPFKNKNLKNYICDDVPAKKYMAQIQLQMYFAGKTKGIFCLAHENFEITKYIDIYKANLDEKYCENLIQKAMDFWKNHIFEKLLLN